MRTGNKNWNNREQKKSKKLLQSQLNRWLWWTIPQIWHGRMDGARGPGNARPDLNSDEVSTVTVQVSGDGENPQDQG